LINNALPPTRNGSPRAAADCSEVNVGSCWISRGSIPWPARNDLSFPEQRSCFAVQVTSEINEV
jgi:hypothetical protein